MKYNTEKLELNMSDFGPDYYSIYNGSYFYYNQGRDKEFESTWQVYTVFIGWVSGEVHQVNWIEFEINLNGFEHEMTLLFLIIFIDKIANIKMREHRFK